MTEERFWSLTPREFEAYKAVWLDSREYLDRRFAEIQATLHNAHFRHERHDPLFQPQQFMPGRVVEEPDPADKALLQKARLAAQMATQQVMRAQRGKVQQGERIEVKRG